MAESVQWQVRLPVLLAAKIETRLEELRAERSEALTRADVVRELLVAGLKALETETTDADARPH